MNKNIDCKNPNCVVQEFQTLINVNSTPCDSTAMVSHAWYALLLYVTFNVFGKHVLVPL